MIILLTVEFELDLSKCATKPDFRMKQVLIHHILLKKTDLASLKSDID